MTRVLPGVYVSLNDLSQVPEGVQTLNVGYVLQANRGPVNEWNLVTSPTDFLTKYTFSGTPKTTNDPTFHSIIKVMAQTNAMYVVRAANNPLYGGAIVKKAKDYGKIVAVNQSEGYEAFLFEVDSEKGQELPKKGDYFAVANTGLFNSYYEVKEVNGNEVKVTGNIDFDTTEYPLVAASAADNTFKIKGKYTTIEEGDYLTVITPTPGSSAEAVNNGFFKISSIEFSKQGKEVYTVFTVEEPVVDADEKSETVVYLNDFSKDNRAYRAPVYPLSAQKIGEIARFTQDEDTDEENPNLENVVYVKGLISSKFQPGGTFIVKGTEKNDKTFTIVSAKDKISATETRVVVADEVEEETVPDNTGYAFFGSLKDPEAYRANPEYFFTEDDLMLITGINAGAYNGKEAFTITSALDKPSELVYVKGASGLFEYPCPFDTMELGVVNMETGGTIESFTFSRDPQAKAIDGSLLYVDDVVAGSAYIKVINNTESTECSYSTVPGIPVQASGGSDGAPVTSYDLAAALAVFEDKTIPISILGNGCSTQAEDKFFQQSLISLADTRKDCMVFLNDRRADEKYTLPSDRKKAIVDYKKSTNGDGLGSTSFYGCMYAPHVKTPDIFNSKEVVIGSDAIAIAGWLNVINNLNYPYAYAGPRNGLVSGVTCDWKIGDMSGEAQSLNDASINYVAYDGRVGRYYMQCQNTLQIASSAMRNIGTVLNVLDIKETLSTSLKEYLGLPITDDLRMAIVDTVREYLSPMEGVRFYNYAFQDVTTDNDLDNDTLRYLLTLSPTRYANRIYLVMNIVRSNFDFSILQSA